MENNIAIRLEGVSKCFQIYEQPHHRLMQDLFRGKKKFFKEFWALKDVSFEVNKGEAVGIVGRNGAGKSTLLQMICGTLSPSSGSIEVDGTVAALLELGSGFNPEFSGRENVYLNASILGLSNEETDKRFDDIAAFADIGDFLEQPTKTYSSGMLMRLAFAVNACVDPEILIIDEALGVGDAPFQSKCFKRLRLLIDKGTTILFVSHDISTVRSICSRALWLNGGHPEMWGDAMEVAKQYERFCWQEQGVDMASVLTEEEELSKDSKVQGNGKERSSFVPQILLEPNPTFDANRQRSRMGTGAVVIKNFLMLNNGGQIMTSCQYNEHINVYYLLEVCESVNSDFIVALRVRDLKGVFVYSINDLVKTHRIVGSAGDRYVAVIEISLPLHHQDYVVSTAIFGFQTGNAYLNGVYDFSQSVIWEALDDAAFITVNQYKFMPLPGPVHVSSDLTLEKI